MKKITTIIEQINRNIFTKDYQLLQNPVDIPEKSCAIYILDKPQENKWYLRAFFGKQLKPRYNYYYTSIESRQRTINNIYNQIRYIINKRKENIDKRKLYKHSFKIGDILYSSWGYEQTNIDYYQIIDVRNKTIIFKELNSKMIDSEHILPIKNSWKNDKIYKKVITSPYLNLDSVRSLKLWDGKPNYQTPAGFGH